MLFIYKLILKQRICGQDYLSNILFFGNIFDNDLSHPTGPLGPTYQWCNGAVLIQKAYQTWIDFHTPAGVYTVYQIYDHVIFPAQVDALKSMETPDPNDDKIVKYAQTLKLSHEAAMKELWGLDKVTEGPDSPKQA